MNEVEPNKQREVIKDELAPLFRQAVRERKFFRSHYQGVVFSPAELKAEHAQGRFLWGSVNWELIDPQSLMIDVERVYRKALNDNMNLAMRIRNGFDI